MLPKVFITGKNTATVICPQCGNATTVNVAKYIDIKQRVTIKCRCACGHQFDLSLEKRRQYRKSTDLPGTFCYRLPNGDIEKGRMRVVDISSSGLKMKLAVPIHFKEGEILKVEFCLNDKKRTLLNKEVTVRNVYRDHVGCAFEKDQVDDANLGFYLMN